MIGHNEIAALIPHSGTMCLIDRVTRWDAASICCRAVSHRDPGNPMLVDGRLGAICGVEYAAQAMAIHGCLAGTIGARPKLGYLASVRELVCAVDRLDDLAGDQIGRAHV
jgi:predicted hotdog family 3-hydroxylacyl-ACP dehydratase